MAHQKKRPGLISMVLSEFGDKSTGVPAQDVDVAAFQPPSDEVRAELARLDREIDAARVVPEDISAPEVAAAPGPEVAAAPVPTAPGPEAPTPAPEAGSADDRYPSSDS